MLTYRSALSPSRPLSNNPASSHRPTTMPPPPDPRLWQPEPHLVHHGPSRAWQLARPIVELSECLVNEEMLAKHKLSLLSHVMAPNTCLIYPVRLKSDRRAQVRHHSRLFPCDQPCQRPCSIPSPGNTQVTEQHCDLERRTPWLGTRSTTHFRET